MQPKCRVPAFSFRCGKALAGSVLLSAIAQVAKADFLEEANAKLSLNLFHNQVRLQLSGTFDLETYFIEQPPPGLIFTDDRFLVNPRLMLFLDAQIGSYVSTFVQARLDRGFDPSDGGAEVRLDEYAIRVSPLKDIPLTVQFGKFGTVVGNWVPRHYSWDNPFINAPLPYENVTGIWDSDAPEDVDELLEWAHVPYEEYTDFGDGYYDKYLRLPVIWGPSYASGVSVSGALGKFDYAAELKNAALSSRPESWDLTQVGFDHPTFSGRIGVRPNEMWNVGFSGSIGPYFSSQAATTLPAGKGIGDYRQILLGQDVSFAWHRFQLWAEVFESRFEVPNVGNADVLSYYIEAKYKITSQLFAAARWNQQLFGTVPDEEEQLKWGNDTLRIDGVLGYRFNNYLQVKLQYSFTHDEHGQTGEHLFGGQFTIRF
jgi:hypothetical protein